jgi:hypothetical protein
MPAKKKSTIPPAPGQPRHYDPSLGKAAVEHFSARMAALEPHEIRSSRIDVEAAALASLATYARATAPSLRARFQKQHDAGEFDIANLDDVEDLAFAVLFAHGEANVHRAAETGAKLPAALVERAIEIEERMQALCEYHFRDDPEIAVELDRLRPASGHRDLASDLNGYARIYELRRDTVALDRKHFRETDVDDARSIAGSILQLLSDNSTSKARTAQDTLLRAWTLLERSYEEVRAVGLHLLRHNQDKHRFFPSLFVAAKNLPPSKKRTRTGHSEATAVNDQE